MRIVTGRASVSWVSKRLGVRFALDAVGFALTDANGTIVGGAVFDRYSGPDIEAHVVGSGFWPRAFLRRLGQYAFDECGVTRVTLHTRSDNARAIRVLDKLATREGVKRRGYGDADTMIYGILKEEWRL